MEQRIREKILSEQDKLIYFAYAYYDELLLAEHIDSEFDFTYSNFDSFLAQDIEIIPELKTKNLLILIRSSNEKVREKAKEVFAYLIDRHGSTVTTKEIAMILYEDSDYDQKTKNIVTKIVSSLRGTFKNAGIEDVLIKTWNHIAVDITKVKCDAYDFEAGDVVAVNSFRGEYMKDYSWAEFTTGRYTFDYPL